MEQIIGVEELRGRLGMVMKEITSGAEPVIVTRRGGKPCVLISRDEYARLRALANRAAAADVLDRMERARKAISEAGVDESVLDEVTAALKAGEL
jgi:prevent-host-death family protein